ncbi:MAG: right-handed parallel beta-helix repeat-containing protein [Candidatus Marinimicrobia bacterium]|nr:right-handed parallel beta-helix repeat-containing protein [Candidatus Neomarinimicrobiota bacterium]
MKKTTVQVLTTLFLSTHLVAIPNILVDGIHGWSRPLPNMSEVSDPAQLFPEYDFDYLDASDIVLDQVIISGYLQSNQDTVTFSVPEASPVLYLRYTPGDTSNLQHPYFFLIDPLGEYSATNCNGLAYVEAPMSGEWTMIYSAWDELDTWYEVGTGPHFYQAELFSQYDLLLQMTDNTFTLFLGNLPQFTDYEYSQLNSYFACGGGYLLLRETDMTMVEKPIIHLTSTKDLSLEVSLNFPGVPTFLEPSATVVNQEKHTQVIWRTNLAAGQTQELLYEGRPPGGMNFLAVENNGSSVHIENYSELNLADIKVFWDEPGVGFRYGDHESLDPGQTSVLDATRIFTPEELSRFLLKELEQEALENGLSSTEAQTFFREYQWINRLITRASRDGNPCAIYNFSGKDYDRLIPLASSHELTDRARIMWVFVDNIPAKIPGSRAILQPAIAETVSARSDESVIFHEYGVIEECYPSVRSLRELSMFRFQFRDEILVDETNNHNNDTWSPIFHTFGLHPVAQILTAGVNNVHGNIAAPITIEVSGSGFVVISGDEDTYADMGVEFPQGSYPPVAVAEGIGNGWFIAVNDINILNTNPDNRQFLQNCFEFLTDIESQIIHVPGDVATIQAAIDSALAGDTVLVAAGVYNENIDFSGKAVCVISETGAAATIIHGDSTGSVVSFVSGETGSAILDGFTIRGGHVYESGPLLMGGAGVLCINASPTIRNNVITTNHCEMYTDGAGLYCNNASPQILNNIISENTGAYYGGGISLRNASNPEITGNTIESNSTMSGWGVAYGAGIYVGTNCIPLIGNNLIRSNIMDFGYGGGICYQGSGSALLKGNLILGNQGAGVVCLDSNRAHIVSNTIFNNTMAVYTNAFAHPVLVNTIVWENAIVVSDDLGPSEITVAYSDVQNGWEGIGNIDADPLFIDPWWWDFNLEEDSPCIDAGTAFYVFGQDTVLDLNLGEYNGNAPDMGALESPPVVDVRGEPNLPAKYELDQNFPNPFNPVTMISYALPVSARVDLTIYSLTGRQVVNLVSKRQPQGYYNLLWDGKDAYANPLSSGIYFCRLTTGSFSKTIKMVCLQ